MKILWIINTILPYPAQKLNMKTSVFGGWLNSLLSELEKSKEIDKIAIVSTYNGNELKKFVDKKITYYLSPVRNNVVFDKETEKYMSMILKEYKPDLVHVHGTEYPHSLAIINECIRYNIKTVTSIQGLISVYGHNNYYFADISIKDILNNITYNKNILLLGTPRDNEYVIDFLDIHRRNLSIVGIHEINGVCQEAREVLFNKILERNIRKEKILDEFVTVYNEYKDNDNKNNFIEIYKE